MNRIAKTLVAVGLGCCMGSGGVQALSKIFALLLAAIAVSMIHRGIVAFIG